ncbi:MAG: exonuclease domain-containing protein [Omnitrophica WOR_2 bacterium]|jgi:DNA polymerase-3 subunit epsilon
MELNIIRPLAIFDLETTGTNVANDRIIEISIVKILPEGKELILTQRINPTIPIPAEATAVHGISNQDLENEPTFQEIAPRIAEFLNNCDLGGYNSNKFDIPLLMEEFLRVDINFELKGRRFVDVQSIFHKMEPRTLKAAYRFYCQKELENAHSAEADAKATYEILKAQLECYKNAEYHSPDGTVSKPIINDIKALHEFSFQNRNADLAGHIIYNAKDREVFNFGKYKGKTVEEIFSMEPSYYDWMMKADFPMYTKKLITAIKLRGFNKKSVNIS